MGLFQRDFFRSLALGFALGAVAVGATTLTSLHALSPVSAASAAPTQAASHP